jgi:hypothetical protein
MILLVLELHIVFKGREAKIVIVLNACNGSFPLIHPDNHLYEYLDRQSAKSLMKKDGFSMLPSLELRKGCIF